MFSSDICGFYAKANDSDVAKRVGGKHRRSLIVRQSMQVHHWVAPGRRRRRRGRGVRPPGPALAAQE
jgi:hypothetical protein